MMNAVKLCYLHSRYPSHRRAAEAYIALLNQVTMLVPDPTSADIVVIHDEPHRYARYFKDIGCLPHKHVIGYAVWEASVLPRAYVDGISLVDEIWTCSKYCEVTFAKYHGNVKVVPHVMEPQYGGVGAHTRRAADRMLSGSCVTFLSVARLIDRRKNVDGLLEAFAMTASELVDARLVLKLRSGDSLETKDNRVVAVADFLSKEAMGCLYANADCYIGVHHSEAWGFCLSDAMLSGVPVIATNYSGNLEYMNSDNSILIDCDERFIEPRDVFNLFDSTMKWGYPDLFKVAEAIRAVYDMVKTGITSDKAQCATSIKETFSGAAIGAVIAGCIRDIASTKL